MSDQITNHLAANLGKCSCQLCTRISKMLGDKQERLFAIVNRTAVIPAATVLWHFTNSEKVFNIDALLPNAAVPAHPPVVWFTTRSNFEPLMVKRDGPPAVKIAVSHDQKLYFNIYSFADKVSKEEFFGVVLSALLVGSDPVDWWVSYNSVPVDKWVDAVILHWQ